MRSIRPPESCLKPSETDVEAPGLTQVQEGALEAPSEVQEDVLPEAPGEEIPVGEESVEQPLPEEASEDVSELAQPDEAPMPQKASVDDLYRSRHRKPKPPSRRPGASAGASPLPSRARATRSRNRGTSRRTGFHPTRDTSPTRQSGQDEAAPALKLPPGSIRTGSTQFLNGGWRTSTSLQDPRTALPVDMEYRLRTAPAT